jgi:hypothetical protein
VDTPRPSLRTKWTRRVPHPVLSGHAASLTPYRFRGVGVFLRLRRFERLAVRQAARGIKLSHCAWLTAHTRGDAAGPDAGAARRVRGQEAAAMQRRAMRVVAFIYTVSRRAPFLLSPKGPPPFLSPVQSGHVSSIPPY